MIHPRRRWMAFLLALMAGLSGETLLLVRTQVGRFERLLRDDFRVLFFVKNEVPQGQVKVLEDRLLGLPEVSEVRFIPRDEALAALRREEPELVDSVSWMGDNPLWSSFEVRPSPAGLSRFADWLSAARDLTDWADVRYRPAQVRAALQAQLYGHFIALILSGLLCALTGALILLLWRRGLGLPEAPLALPAALGAAAGLGLALAASWPARGYLPWWEMPRLPGQFLVWGAAVLVAGLFFPWASSTAGD